MNFLNNEIIGTITVIAAIVTYLPYLRDTIRGKVKPHPFSWTIWVLLTAIAYIVQVIDGAGPGAWMNAAVLAICVFIIICSFKNGFKNITLFDKVVFGIGLASIPLWIVTSDPLWSVILVSFANTIAYIPTFRKSYNKPHEEALYLYSINLFRHGLSITALANFALTTALFPAVLSINNGALAIFLIIRRYQLRSVGKK
ncbi:MAG: hypothetical protein OXR68_04835 [Alphaproteobacteria bacterium]|nr:hypothetical protein [Alphaproteobacteria bacterium]MDD9919934.1 hypothetical protein [Alphaproteobacteria bacterium]